MRGAELCIALSPSDPRSMATLNLGAEVVYFGAPDVILNVLRGLHERLAARHIDCAGGMAAR
jgi:hypothetical protein